MKITNKTNFVWTKLHETHIGDVFFFEDTNSWGEEPFIRIKDVSEVQCCGCGHDGYDVLSLETFEVWEPKAEEKVRVVNAELIITNKGQSANDEFI